MSPAACSVPGFRPGENAGRTVEEENARVLNLETPLWIQSNVRKAAASSMGSSVASSYEDPADCVLDGDDDGNPTPRDREIPKVLPVLASVLERLVTRNEQFANSPAAGVFNPKKLTIFHGLKAPGISIAKYLERIFKYTSCSPSCFVVGYVFIDRLIHRQPDLLLTSLNVHRLLVTSVMVATKMLDDVLSAAPGLPSSPNPPKKPHYSIIRCLGL